MISVNVWQEIDYLAFHENAILLDVKLRSQGDPIRSVIRYHYPTECLDGLTPNSVCSVLDDFALVVSGNGGKDNVSAVCMEYGDEPRTITLRVASNDGISKPTFRDLQGLMRLITNTSKSGTEQRCGEVLTIVLQQCSSMFLKHVNKFLNELKQARCPPDKHLRFPTFSTENGTVESATDTEQLGPYNSDSHQAYMQLGARRLRALRKISIDLATSETQLDISKMGLLARTAYDVQRSGSFDRILRHNLLASQKPTAVQSMAYQLKERLGKISRVWRAAKTFTAFGSAMLAHKITLNLLCLPTSRQSLQELRGRTLTQLRGRGGPRFQSCNADQLLGKLAQWRNYRLHCEMQLVVFYQENPHLQLRSRYIGCNKLACYLCYHFITNHGQFQVKGCHQGLYSLWTVPLVVDFEQQVQAIKFNFALRQLANTLERKVDAIRTSSKSRWKYRTNHESTANLSRISLEWLNVIGAVFNTRREASSTNESRQLFQPAEQSRSRDPQSKHENLPSLHVVVDESAMKSAHEDALDRLSYPIANTAQASDNTEPLCEKEGTLRDSRKGASKRPSTTSTISSASTSTETSRKLAPVIRCSGNKLPTEVSHGVGHTRPTPLLQPATMTPQIGAPSLSQGRGKTSSPPESLLEIQTFTDLCQEQHDRFVHAMGDHEGRISDIPCSYRISDEHLTDHLTMPCLDDMSQTFNFHDTGLSLEVECPRGTRPTVVQCARLDSSNFKPIVKIDKIEPGECLRIDIGEDFSMPRILFLTKRSSKGIDQWWACQWTEC